MLVCAILSALLSYIDNSLERPYTQKPSNILSSKSVVGAGADNEVGENAAQESDAEINGKLEE